MSAGDDTVHTVPLLPTAAKVVNGLEYLAPKFEAVVVASLAECDALGLQAVVYETYRTNELAKAYYAKGRTAPGSIVTNARDNLHSFHGFGLAVDVIHKTMRWDAGPTWWREMADVFKKHGAVWGGDWSSFKDLPHFQFGTLTLKHASPDDEDRRLLISGGGLIEVWKRHDAI